MKILILLAMAAGLHAHDAKGKAWAPASAKGLKNPVPAADAAQGQAPFQSLCAGCHSVQGKAPDLGGHHVHGLKDGEIYWIITNGAGKKMPGFAKQLSELERWRVVNYVRTLHK
jgi:mono/diheme cytochrome c family protein